MAIIHVDESYPGLPNSGRLSGTNGDLVGIMDVALPLNGWAIEYTSGNARVYRPGTGNRFRMYVNDDSASSGNAGLTVVRGCENASAASLAGLTDPFPTVALVAENASNWLKSTAASTAARAFDMWIGETWLIYAVNAIGTTNQWEWHFFGDFAPSLSGDAYNTLCTVRNNTSTGSGQLWSCAPGYFGNAGRYWIARSYDGTVKSTQGSPYLGYAGTIGVIGNAPQAQAGVTTGIDTQKVSILDTGTTTTTPSTSKGMPTRGWLPNIRFPLHGGRGATNTRDTYTDTAYDPSYIGQIVTAGNTANAGFLTVETTDTWSPPSG